MALYWATLCCIIHLKCVKRIGLMLVFLPRFKKITKTKPQKQIKKMQPTVNPFFFFFWAVPDSLYDLSFLTRGLTCSMTVKVPSPDHWITREFLVHDFKSSLSLSIASASSFSYAVSFLAFPPPCKVSCFSYLP